MCSSTTPLQQEQEEEQEQEQLEQEQDGENDNKDEEAQPLVPSTSPSRDTTTPASSSSASGMVQPAASQTAKRILCTSTLLCFYRLIVMIHTYTQNAISTPSMESISNKSSYGNRTLVILTGSVRGGEQTWQTLYENVLDTNMADLALVVGWDEAARNTSSLYQRAKFIWEFPEFNDWGDAIDLIEQRVSAYNATALDTDNTSSLPPSYTLSSDMLRHNSSNTTEATSWRYYARQQNNGLFGATREDPQSSGAIQNFARWILSNMIQQLALLPSYDRFIMTRTDHYYLCDIQVHGMNLSNVWVPWGEDYGGICDRWFMGSSSHVLRLLNNIAPLVQYPQAHRHSSMDNQTEWNIESFMKQRWYEQGIDDQEVVQRFDRVMFTAAVEGDTSRWQNPLEVMEEGVRVKYPREYEMSKESCGRREGEGRRRWWWPFS